jgi:hypothetical protein
MSDRPARSRVSSRHTRSSGPSSASLGALALALGLGACTTLPGVPAAAYGPAGEAAACDAFAVRLDDAVRAAGVGDAQLARVGPARWLRVDRFDASFAAEPLPDAATRAWLERLRAADADARRVEVSNLPRETRAALADAAPGATPAAGSADAASTLAAAIAHCGRAETAALARDADTLGRVRTAARVPDDYVGWQRALGLYPIAVLPFGAGVQREEARGRAAFTRNAARIAEGTIRYAPAPSDSSTSAIVPAGLPRDALGVPVLDARQRDALLVRHAPVLAIAGDGPDNRFGRPTLGTDDRAAVDTSEPWLHGRVAFTRWEGAVRVQLVYTAWFPRRPPTGALDLLAGHLDGVILRLTLDEDGRVAMVDAIHACGCWHLFVPVGERRVRPQPVAGDEWAFVPARLAAVPPGARVRIRLASGTHALEGIDTVGTEAAADASYRLADEDTLRTLARPGGGTRSLYDPRGRVPGTERAERWLFWPMGIADAGSMRQWGRHATAFVGRRHFDEPDVLERRFEPGVPVAGDD